MKCEICRGSCCEEIVITSSVIGSDFPKVIVEFLTARGTPAGNGCFAIHAVCPKLNVNGLCSIHDTKPLACALEPVGGAACLDAVSRRRSPEEYLVIRDEEDPETWEDLLLLRDDLKRQQHESRVQSSPQSI